MYGNKASILVNKIKGQVKSINLIKHAFREVVDKKDNVYQSQNKNNFYWIEDKLFTNEQTEKSIFMKDLLLNKIDIVKKEFEKTMLKTRNTRKQTWESYSTNKYLMQEVLINISPIWWEQQKFVNYHEELIYNKENETVDKYKWGIKDILNSQKLQAWGESQIDWVKQELKDTYGNDSNYLGASLHVDEKTPHIHIFLATVDLSFDKRKGREVFKLSTSPFSRNRYDILQTSIWKHNQKHWDKNLVRGISKKITNYNYKSLSHFRNSTNLKMIKNHLEIEKTKQKWLTYQQGWMLNDKKIKELMRDMIIFKSVNKNVEYENAKQELIKLGLNLEQTNEIEKFVDRTMERNK